MSSARRFQVRGRVQGVGFRHYAWRSAAELGLSGWVRNRFDGSVEVLARGSSEQLDLLEGALRAGPRLARVDRVETAEATPDEAPSEGFEVRSTS